MYMDNQLAELMRPLLDGKAGQLLCVSHESVKIDPFS
jgi:hypothetical protein